MTMYISTACWLLGYSTEVATAKQPRQRANRFEFGSCWFGFFGHTVRGSARYLTKAVVFSPGTAVQSKILSGIVAV